MSNAQAVNLDADLNATPEALGFAILQKGKPIRPSLADGYWTYQLKSAPFVMASRHAEIVTCTAEADHGFVRGDAELPVLCVSGSHTGATGRDSSWLFVADATERDGSNNLLASETGAKVDKNGLCYTVNTLLMQRSGWDIPLSQYRGTLYVYFWIDLDSSRSADDGEIGEVVLQIGKD